MKKIVCRLFLILLSAFSFQLSAYTAEALTSQELLQDAEKYDGKTVTYQGEAIGDILIQGEFAWINLRDEQGALGVFAARESIEVITNLGSYLARGDVVSVRGIFNRSCTVHGGDTDIHAEKITVIAPGEVITHPVEPEKLKLAIILGVVVLILAIVHLIARRMR